MNREDEISTAADQTEKTSPDQVGETVESSDTKQALARFPIVGIGASAGGLKALEQFFHALPEQSGMAFVVVTHMARSQVSELATLLQRYTPISVKTANHKDIVRPDTIYVIPPGKILTIDQAVLELADPPSGQEHPLAIDLFLRSLAEDQAENAVAIILSGTGADGTLGIKAIKEQAGIAMAQTPEDAEFDTMPRNAIATGLIDFSLPAAELPTKLVEIEQHKPDLPILKADNLPENEAEILQKIFALLRSKIGHDFTHYKRSTVLRRMSRRMQVKQVMNLGDYLIYLRKHADEVHALFKELMISVTNFFRDPEVFETLRQRIIPQLFQRKEEDEKVRVWVAGCATGEEAYSIALLLADYASKHNLSTPIQIFATDIDVDALQVAREGLYPDTIANDLPADLLRRYFVHERQGYRVSKEIRKLILFTTHDLLRDPPFSKLDLVSCRNVLIYFNRTAQDHVFRLFHYALHETGILFLGGSESVEGAKSIFYAVDPKQRFFRPQLAASPTLWVTALAPDELVRERRSAAEAPRKPTINLNELHQRLLVKQYAPPSIIVNEHYQVLHIFAQAGRYLQFGEGAPSHNILEMTPAPMRLELRTALYQAFQRDAAPNFRRVRRVHAVVNGHERLIDLIVQRIADEELAPGLAQVIFEEVELAEASQANAVVDSGADQQVKFLETELQYTKEQLQTLIEQYETSHEELQASNEELVAMNEELQSATEELETGREELQSMNEELEASKEEMQSINEELVTVNEELQSKLDELSMANTDLKNLIASTEIALIFLNTTLEIKRYTPGVTEIFNIIPSDLGRPLTHITGKLLSDGLLQDMQGVLKNSAKLRREVQTTENTWYIMQIVPYRTLEDRVDGIVITFVDISELQRARTALEALNQHLEARVAQRTDQVRALSSALTLAEQWERRRISQVLHDHLQQLLYGLQMRTQMLTQDLGAIEQSELMTQLNELTELLNQAIVATRTLTVELNPPVLEGEGLDQGLRWLVHHVQETYGLNVDLNISPLAHPPNESMRMLLIQLVRELLFNVVKHARVTQAVIQVREEAEWLVIQVKDQGIGFDATTVTTQEHQLGHFGLFSVNERLALFGGELEIESGSDQGTQITMRAPIT